MSERERNGHFAKGNETSRNPGQWKKGQSGNPGGQPKSYERQLREVVSGMTALDPENPSEQIPAWRAIVKRAVIDAVAGDRYARDFVADRLIGKPTQTVAVTDTPAATVDMTALTDAQIEALAALPLLEPSDETGDDATEH